MEVILTQTIPSLGKTGDVVQVKNGYARNFLLPTKRALRLTEQNRKLFEARKAEIEKENAEHQDSASKLAKSVEGLMVTLIRQASEDGRLYGSVRSQDIAEIVCNAGHKIGRQQVELNQSIKELGIHPVTLQLFGDVSATILINIARSESEALDAKKRYENPEKDAAENDERKERSFTPKADQTEAPATTAESEQEDSAEAPAAE